MLTVSTKNQQRLILQEHWLEKTVAFLRLLSIRMIVGEVVVLNRLTFLSASLYLPLMECCIVLVLI